MSTAVHSAREMILMNRPAQASRYFFGARLSNDTASASV